MDIKNNDCLAYVRPIGEDLQHVVNTANNTASLHSDIYLLTRLSDMQVSKNLQDAILSRFQDIKDDLPSELSDQVQKLSDDDIMKTTDSRYAQWLSDRKDRISSLMSEMKTKAKEIQEKEKLEKVEKANDALRDFALRLSNT